MDPKDMNSYLRIGEAAQRLGVCNKTQRRWYAAGKIKSRITVGGHRCFALLEIKRLTGDVTKKESATRKIAIYCRVSSHEQKKKGDIDRQVSVTRDYCLHHENQEPVIFQNIGSGLNTRRRGLVQLCTRVERGEFAKVIVTYPDRLTRFGVEYLTNYFCSHGTVTHFLDHDTTRSMEEELVKDLIAIVTSFSGRVHGLRSHKNRQKRKRRAPTNKGVTISS